MNTLKNKLGLGRGGATPGASPIWPGPGAPPVTSYGAEADASAASNPYAPKVNVFASASAAPTSNPYAPKVNVFGGEESSNPYAPKTSAYGSDSSSFGFNRTSSSSAPAPTQTFGASVSLSQPSYSAPVSQPAPTPSYSASSSYTPSYSAPASTQPAPTPTYNPVLGSLAKPVQPEKKPEPVSYGGYNTSSYSGLYGSDEVSPYDAPQSSGSDDYDTSSNGDSEIVATLRKQLQLQKNANDLLSKKLEHAQAKANEERGLLMQELSHIKLQADSENSKVSTVEKENLMLKSMIDQHNSTRIQLTNELQQTKALVERERAVATDLNTQVVREKDANIKLNDLASKLKQDLEQERAIKQRMLQDFQKLNEQINATRAELDAEKNSKAELGKNFQELSTKYHDEKGRHHMMLEEILSMKEKNKTETEERNKLAAQSTELEAELKRAHGVIEQLQNDLNVVSQKFAELDKKKQDFENLGLFSDKLIQSVPTFEAKVDELSSKLSSVSFTSSSDGHVSAAVGGGRDNELHTKIDSFRSSWESESAQQNNSLKSLLAVLESINTKLSGSAEVKVSAEVSTTTSESTEETSAQSESTESSNTQENQQGKGKKKGKGKNN
eukprot:TRINITY_DN468_c0_g2_i1.p1 TRINITY_DN468_c0_g2~~TRINITY_DN468_c0_g2_i1.p1  ORF type:complete len:612 (+),score=231.75 TRINITY_DN468_c0_g2_i1:2522-4357(+)